MAGGSGSRLRPLTCGRPKPMVPLMNKPVMEYIIELLKKHNITDIGVTLQYLPEMIKNTFGDGSDWGVNLKYFIEESPLGTAGSVKNAEEFLSDTFIVISGDALTDTNLDEAIKFHKENEAKATLVLKEVSVPLEYGVVVTDEIGSVKRFVEKPSWSEVFSNTVNTGIYVIEPSVLSSFKKGEVFDFSQDLFPMMLENKEPLFGYITNDYWCDIGDIQSYIQSHFDILDGKVRVDLKEKNVREGVFIGNGVDVHADVIIKGPVLIGDNCKIGRGVKVEPYSVIGEDVTINNNCSIKRSIVWKQSTLGTKSHLSGSILCYRANIKSNVAIYEQAVVGDDSQIKEGVVIKPNVKIWPHKVVESGTTVSDNVIWGTKYSKTLFGKNGISGEVNIEITPEFASKLGTAFGSTLKLGSKICVSSDEASYSQMIKHAIVSGCISAGIEVYDLGYTVMPIARNVVSFLNLDGGIHVKAYSDSNTKIGIEFLDKVGSSISRSQERKIENVFVTGEFRRCESSRLKFVNMLTDYNYFYFQNLLNTINSEAIRKVKFKLVCGETTPFIRTVLQQICNDLKCEITYSTQIKENALEALSSEVVLNKASFGLMIDSTAEKLILVDNLGRIIKGDLYTALISIVSLKTSMINSVVVPITASNVIETLASKYNSRVIRTKTSDQEIMSTILKEKADKNANGFYILNYDSFASLVKIMDYMTTENLKLSAIIETIPAFFTTQKNIACPWEAKGKVMRSLIQDKGNSEMELYEGVKIYDERGWVLVLPDAEQPLCTVYSEGLTKEIAESLSEIYIDKIRNIITG